MRLNLLHVICFLGLFAGSFWPETAFAEQIRSVEGEVSFVGFDHVVMEGLHYPVIMQASEDYRIDGLVPSPQVIIQKTGAVITYGTIQAVGYITAAQLSLRGGKVFKIIILDMQQ